MFYSPNLWLEHMFWLSDTWELRKIRIEIPMYIYDMIASYLCQSLQPNLLDSSIILKFKRQGIYYAFGKTCRAILMIFFDWTNVRSLYLFDGWCRKTSKILVGKRLLLSTRYQIHIFSNLLFVIYFVAQLCWQIVRKKIQ